MASGNEYLLRKEAPMEKARNFWAGLGSQPILDGKIYNHSGN